jgi:hypothetical protein
MVGNHRDGVIVGYADNGYVDVNNFNCIIIVREFWLDLFARTAEKMGNIFPQLKYQQTEIQFVDMMAL